MHPTKVVASVREQWKAHNAPQQEGDSPKTFGHSDSNIISACILIFWLLCTCVCVRAQGQLIVFDDSKKHFAFNNHPTHGRVVLIFDIERPEALPKGLATGATTKELIAFMDYFK